MVDGSTPRDESEIIACPGCDALIPVPHLPESHHLICGRCGTVVAKMYSNSVNRVLALTVSGLLLFLPAMLLPLLTLSSIGFSEQGNVITTCLQLAENDYYLGSLMVLATAVFFPFLKLLLPFIVSLCLKIGKKPAGIKACLKIFKHVDEWGMVEVYLLGIVISLIKMNGLASISYHSGFFCFIVLVLLTMATSVCLDNKLFWDRIDNRVPDNVLRRLDSARVVIEQNVGTVVTAASIGLLQCHECGRLVLPGKHKEARVSCTRCNSTVHKRTPASFSKTFALVLTSFILFFPANMLPIMQVNFLGIPDRSTILDGIIYFFEEGSYGIGVIILTASILVPLFKIIGLLILLFTTYSGKDRFLRQKAKMFRFIEFIGRWSMLDIFVIALLSVLVNFGFLTSIHTAPAATYFCIVVVCTMIAAIVFDPRIMWDKCAPSTFHHHSSQESHEKPASR